MENIINEGIISSDIADYERLIGEVNRFMKRDSLVAQVSDIQPMKGPVAKVTGANYNVAQGKLTIDTRTLEAESRTITTSFTQEAFKDLFSIYGEDAYEIVGHYLANEISRLIDNDFITYLKGNAIIEAPLTFNPADFKDWAAVTNNILIKMNREKFHVKIKTQRPFHMWSIVSINLANALFSNSLIGGTKLETNGGLVHLGKIVCCDYYLDADYIPEGDNLDYCIVGVKGDGISGASTVWAPYQNLMNTWTHPDSGERYLQLINRGQFTMNPLDTSIDGTNSSDYMHMFEVDLSGFETV